jgi:hypothetical protein
MKVRARGRQITVSERGPTDYGCAQPIQKLDDGYVAGSEPRCDGQAAGFWSRNLPGGGQRRRLRPSQIAAGITGVSPATPSSRRR